MKKEELLTLMRSKAIFFINRVQLIIVSTIILIICTSYLISGFSKKFLTQTALPSVELIREVYRNALAPEPLERMIFIILGLLIPIWVTVITFFSSKVWKATIEKKMTTFNCFLSGCISVIFLIPFFGSDFSLLIVGKYGKKTWYGYESLFGSIFISVLICFFLLGDKNKINISLRRTANIAFSLLIVISLLLTSFTWRLLSINLADFTPMWSFHLDAVSYALSQVIAGKTVLVDMPSQYGLFPEMLAPLFSIIGSSIFNLSLTFAVMQIVSLISLLIVLSRLVRNRIIFFIASFAILLATFGSVIYLNDLVDPYYQYWPIRFFWPAISTLVFYWFTTKKTFLRAVCMSLVGGCGLLWNLDTGLFITLAFGSFLAVRWIVMMFQNNGGSNAQSQSSNWVRKQYLLALSIHVLTTFVVVASFFIYLYLKAGSALSFDWLFKYQSIFYKLGFFMLPIPFPNEPWVSILLVYLAGLVFSLSRWWNYQDGVKTSLIFYLSLIGFGLFIYYQGRSHVLVMTCVYWPSLIILTFFIEDILRFVRLGRLSKLYLTLPITTLAFLIFLASNFLKGLPTFTYEGISNYRNQNKIHEPLIQSELLFIKNNLKKGSICFIFSQRQGIYYLESGLSSPIKGPGLVETILVEDEQKLIRTIMDGKLNCIFLGVKGSDPGFNISSESIFKIYDIVSKNAEETMFLLKTKMEN